MSTVNRALKPYPVAGVATVDTSDAGGGGSGGTFPTGLPLWARYKASSMTGVSDGAMAAQWDDISGNTRHATQATSARRPIKRNSASGLSGNTVAFEFTGNDSDPHFLGLPDMSALTEGEIFAFVKADADTSIRRLWELGTSVDGYYPYSSGVIYETFGTNSRKTTVDPTPLLTDWRNYNAMSQTNDYRTRLDNTEIFHDASNTVAFPSSPTIGGYLGGTSGFRLANKLISEIIILNTVATAPQRADIDAYFQGEYNGGGGSPPSGSVVVSWNNRNRLTPQIVKQSAATEALETGQTTTVEVYGQDGTTLLRTITGLTGTSYTYTVTSELSDTSSAILQTSLTFKIHSVRDGFSSSVATTVVTR